MILSATEVRLLASARTVLVRYAADDRTTHVRRQYATTASSAIDELIEIEVEVETETDYDDAVDVLGEEETRG